MHKFDAKQIAKLESENRKAILPAKSLLEQFGLKENMIVADIGSGSGYFTFPASEIVGEDGYVYSLDISQEMLDYQQEKMAKEDVKNICLVKSEESELVLKDSSVEYGILSMVLHEVKYKKAFMVELRRIIKEKGHLFILEWAYKASHMGPEIEDRLSFETIEKLLKEQGFTVVQSGVIEEEFQGILAKKL